MCSAVDKYWMGRVVARKPTSYNSAISGNLLAYVWIRTTIEIETVDVFNPVLYSLLASSRSTSRLDVVSLFYM
jgi:hypothetical protein